MNGFNGIDKNDLPIPRTESQAFGWGQEFEPFEGCANPFAGKTLGELPDAEPSSGSGPYLVVLLVAVLAAWILVRG